MLCRAKLWQEFAFLLFIISYVYYPIERFGSVAEVGIFVMTSQGLADVSNPSELFMSSAVLSDGVEGSAVAIVMEGSR